MSKQVDLTTLTGWANLSAGEHTITIKAKADGYRDSQASAGVSATKESSGYKVTITYSGLSSGLCFYSLDNGSTWVDGYISGQTQLVLTNVEQIKFKVQADYSHYCSITRQSGDNFNSLYASSGGSETSSNITLTQDMVVQFAAGSD